MKKIILSTLVIGLAIIGNPALSQRVISPSPTAAGLTRSMDIPVNLYTGVPQINVPFYSLPHSNGASIPVGISYHAGGIKVQDVAGPVGLGWNLSAGGMITRVVRGLPDEDNNFFNPAHTLIKFIKVAFGEKDGEHDMFYFSYPGRGGQFQVDKAGDKAYTMPYQDIDIDKIGTFSNCQWVITDEMGNKYYFGETTATREESHITVEENGVNNPLKERNYVSTWYLTKIKYLNSPHEVTFSYIAGTNYNYDNYFASNSKSEQSGCVSDTLTQVITNTEIVSPKYISEITTKMGAVNFVWGSSRLDLNMKPLRGVEILDYSDNLIESFSLTYDYFDADDSYKFKEGTGDTRYEDGNSCSYSNCYRLKLDKIDREVNGYEKMYREFTYNEELLQGVNNYNVYDLPPRDSHYFDHWGYSNGINAKIIKDGIPYDPDSRLPHEDHVQAAMLNRIDFGGGSYQEFVYELNKAHNGLKYGGLRIKEIKNGKSTDDTNPIAVSYEYEQGFGFEYPKYSYNKDDEYSCDTKVTFSSAPNHIFDMGGAAIGYTLVKKNNPNGSQEQYTFISPFHVPDTDPIYTIGSDVYDYPRISPYTSNHYRRGLNISVKQLEFPSPTLVNELHKTSFTYHTLDPNPAVSFENIFNIDGYGGQYLCVASTYYSNFKIVRLFQTEEFNEGHSDPTSRTTFRYDGSEYKTLVREKESLHFNEDFDISNNSAQFRTNYRYYHDLLTTVNASATTEVKALAALENAKAIGIPIETYVSSIWLTGILNSEHIFSSHFSTFTDYGTFIAPYRQYSLEVADPINAASYDPVEINGANTDWVKDARLVLKSTQLYNPTDGNLSQTTGSDGVNVTYAWGYNNALMTSEAANGFTKSYQYIPLVGVSKITDVNGRETNYEYDNENRLHLIRDHEDNIIERYRYYTDGDNTSVDFTVFTHSTSTVKTFSIKDSEVYGTSNQFIWDLGDGTVVDNATDQVVTHNYSQAGSYTVTLTILNPDYDEPFHISKAILVQN